MTKVTEWYPASVKPVRVGFRVDLKRSLMRNGAA